jgi:fermentation-respiration switch protein FrsA (DUF1100 family)
MAKAGRKTRWRIGIALVLLLTGCGALRRFEYSQVYHPTKRVILWPDDMRSARQDIYFSTSDGVKLNGWYFPAATNSPRKQMAILVCHGNGGNISYLKNIYGRLAETGANVLLFDYRGYGNSDGRPGEEGTYVDGQAAYAWLRQKGFAATNIIVYGESLGGGVASELVLREPAAGLVLESTFTSTPDVGAVLFPWLPVHLLSTIKYDTHSKLPRVKIPVLIMHSHQDGLIPFRLAKKNFTAANEPKLFWEIKGGHAVAGEECHVGMEKFLSALEEARQQGREVKF